MLVLGVPGPYIAAQWTTLLSSVGVDPTAISLRSLRRGGATYAYYNGASLQDTKTHGTWASDAVGAYIGPPYNNSALGPKQT